MTRRTWPPIAALGLIVAITAGWWALALWPLPSEVPAWLAEARFVCFGARIDTLPSASGWLLLIGEPVALLAFLLVGWGAELADGLRALNRVAPGRWALGAVTLLMTGGGFAGLHRVTAARAEGPAVAPAPSRWVDAEPPPLPLVTQAGEPFSLAALRGRSALVVFAYGHCETVCPVAVRDALAARDALPRPTRPRLVVVSLDPWRDVPARLPALADAWHLEAGDYALSGDVPTVERALDAWRVGRSRNPQTGEIVHAPLTVVIDGSGRLAARTEGTAAQLAEVLSRLQ